jgi:hypothetical protein
MQIIPPQEDEPIFDQVSGAPKSSAGPQRSLLLVEDDIYSFMVKVLESLSKMTNQYQRTRATLSSNPVQNMR